MQHIQHGLPHSFWLHVLLRNALFPRLNIAFEQREELGRQYLLRPLLKNSLLLLSSKLLSVLVLSCGLHRGILQFMFHMLLPITSITSL